MNIQPENRVFHFKKHNSLDSFVRKIFQNPKKILGKYVKECMTVMDFGCGPGFFTLEIAKLVGKNGKVIAVDFQQEMLDIIKKKISGNIIEKIIVLHKSSATDIGVSEKVDMVIAFYVIHELDNTKKFLSDIRHMLKKDAILFIAEPNFKISESEFKELVRKANTIGFSTIEYPRIFLSRCVVFKNG
ncbi:MAG: class I SAM-dependent methyltransferase [archaeon]